jgi:hypothetical protein
MHEKAAGANIAIEEPVVRAVQIPFEASPGIADNERPQLAVPLRTKDLVDAEVVVHTSIR